MFYIGNNETIFSPRPLHIKTVWKTTHSSFDSDNGLATLIDSVVTGQTPAIPWPPRSPDFIFICFCSICKWYSMFTFNQNTTLLFGSRDSSVGIATGWTARVLFPAMKDFPVLCSVQTDSGAHPASCPLGTRGSFPQG
jgi:hypothetical protein